MTGAKTRHGEKAKRNERGDCECFTHLTRTWLAQGSDWRDWDAALRYEGLPIQVISIDNTGRDAMKERWEEDILPKTKWVVKMDCDKRWKERATSRRSRGCGEM
jgi:hypothetical protein